MSATGTARAKKSAAKALDAEQIADVVIAPKPKAKKIPAALNLVQPKAKAVTQAKGKTVTAKTAKATKPAAATTPAVPAGQKFCKRHNTTHPLEDFAKDSSSPSGRYSICRRAEAEDRAAKKAKAATAAA